VKECELKLVTVD